MEIKQLLQKLKDNEIDISLNGDNIDISYDGELNKQLLNEIILHKPDIISFLKNTSDIVGGFADIPALGPQNAYALSSSQKRLWVLSQFEDANLAYNMRGVYEFEGDLNIDALELALKALIERHEILRTIFKEDGAGEIKQVIIPAAEAGFKLGREDLSTNGNIKQAVEKIIQAEMQTLFNLATGPLFKAKLIKTAAHKYVFNYVMHHIISDGWSMEVMIKELFILYVAFSEGNGNPIPPLRIQYKDFAAWQQAQLSDEHVGSHKNYWLKQFEGELPVLELPSDKTRPALKTYNGARADRLLNAVISKGIKQLSLANGSTLFMGVLASVNALLHRYTNQEDIIIGSGIAGRDHADLENQIGFYLSTLALRTKFKGDGSFADLLVKVKEVTLGAYEHQVYPFDELINTLSLKHDMSRGALFDVSVVLQNTNIIGSNEPVQDIGKLSVKGYGSGTELVASTFDLSFTFEEYGDELHVLLIYNTDIYTAAFAERMLAHLEQLLLSIIDSPVTPINRLNYLSSSEIQQLLTGFNATDIPYPKEQTVVALFEARVKINPDNIALVTEDKPYTYQQLNEQANQLASYLRKNYHIKADDLVAVKLERRDQMLIALLGILKAGGAYVPLDPDYPQERIAYIVADSNCKLLIDEEELAQFHTERSRYSKADLVAVTAANNLAYVIYTSGSTGTPKGVMVEHRSLVNLCFWHNQTFSVTADDRSSLYLGVAFDASVSEIFPYLIAGAALYAVPKAIRSDAGLLSDFYTANNITMSALTTQIGEQFLAADNASLRYLIIGGDKLNTITEKPYHIVNQYGPTENTVVTTNCVLTAEQLHEKPPIGKPISNVQVYILDAHNQLLPVGVAGELCIAGAGLARGYLNNEALTSKMFIAHPFKTNERIYKTGDLCKWLPDGNIVYIGRKDDQVKIRGYRIEPGEIASTLRTNEKISEAIVVARPDANGDNSLVAYVVGKEALNASDLRAYLKLTLPDFMLPEYYVQLTELPLGSNGKINKKALPNPAGLGVATGAKYTAPRNETETKLVALWETVLGRTHIGVEDDFFELGGHSLKATRLSSQIYKAFEVQVSLTELFVHTSIEAQAQLISRGIKSFQPAILPLEKQADYALSSSQRRLWLLSQFEEGNIAYNMPVFYEFKGKLDVNALERAFKTLIDRHEILRTVFRQDAEGVVKQTIYQAAETDFKIAVEDIRNGQDKPAYIKALVQSTLITAFDLAQGPLIAVRLVQTDAHSYLLCCVMHHIISDGWSMGVLIKELLTVYAAYSKEQENPLQPLKIQYKDYAGWQQQQLSGESLNEHKTYWLNQFSGELPVLELPADKLRPAIKTYNGSIVAKAFNKKLSGDFNALCQSQSGTLFMGLLAVINTLLHKYTNQDDIILGSPIAGRAHADLDDQIGCYLNTLALRTKFSGEDNFIELFDRVKTLTLGAYEHQVYPFDELVDNLALKRDASRSALFDVMVILQNTEATDVTSLQKLHELDISSYNGGESKISKFDLTFNFEENEDALAVAVEYNTDIYTEPSVQRLLSHLEQLITAIVADPSRSINNLAYIDKGEAEQLLVAFNDTELIYAKEKTIIDLFEKQVSLTPSAIALVADDKTFTYAALNEQTNQLAGYLRETYKIKPDELIGVRLDRSEWLVISLLAILKAGAAYVPLDPQYPQDRIDYLLHDTQCKAVIDEAELARFRQKADGYQKNNLAAVNTADHLAYVIYTSGSTGKPKGVMIEHRNVVSFFANLKTRFNLAAVTRMAALTNYTFDISVLEILGTLVNAVSVHLFSEKNSGELLDHVEKGTIDSLQLTPSKLSQLLEQEQGSINRLKKLKVLLIGGEPMREQQYYKLKGLSNTNVINVYGPTETTIWSSSLLLHESDYLSIGKPLYNESIYILSEKDLLVPIGVSGEICIGGAGVARGYLNNAELTAGKFTENPFKKGERIYKTGDVGRWLPDGNVVIVGRKDEQVKINGHRIEPGEIERVLLTHTEITAAVLVATADASGDKALVAYVVSKQELNAGELRAYLKNLLPAYMLPAYFVQLEALPLNSSGKVNKKALPNPEGMGISTGAAYVAPRNEMEENLVAIWSNILGIDKEKIGIKDDFFDLGGHSLKATRLVSELNREFKLTVNLKVVFMHPTIEALADEISNDLWFKTAVVEEDDYTEIKI